VKIYDKLYILRYSIPNYVLQDIDDWNVQDALELAKLIDDSYAFRFQRRGLEEERLPGRYNVKASIIKESGTYYWGGYIETVDDIRARIELNHEKKTEKDHTLLRMLEKGKHTTIIRSIDTDKWSCVFNEETDVLLEDDNGISTYQQPIQGD
jgi:hypothetical protein